MKNIKDAALAIQFKSVTRVMARGLFVAKSVKIEKDGSLEVKLHKKFDKEARILIFGRDSYDDFSIEPIYLIKDNKGGTKA